MNKNKDALLNDGLSLVLAFCELNNIIPPAINMVTSDKWPYSTCAYYRKNVIHICVPKCAHIGVAGRQWSYPGYVVDRTPYGVLQHELGHHVDVIKGTKPGAYWSEYSEKLRAETGEKKITNYCPNDAEWFAEIFRLFVTNPDLLKQMRPLTYGRLISDGFKPVYQDTWQNRLSQAPERTINAATNRIKKGN